MKLEAVILGMDGVLINTREYHYLSWQQLTEHLGIPFERRDHDKLCGLASDRQALDILFGGLQLSETEIGELLEYKDQYLKSYIDRIGTQDLLPGAFELLWELHAAQIPVGVSSTDPKAPLIISRLGINYHIEAICTGNNVGKTNLPSNAFLCTASRLEVQPENCMVIEECKAGIQAGLSAGMCVVGVGKGQWGHQLHAFFPSLENVRLTDLQSIYKAWWAEDAHEEKTQNRPRLIHAAT